MPKKKDDAKPDPVMDVSRPGKATPSDNSKSVIVTSRPIMKDPMVVKVTDGTEEQPTPPKAKSSTKSVIQPLNSAEAVEKPAEAEPADDSAKDAPKSKETKPSEGKTVEQMAAEATARRKAVEEPETPKETPKPKAEVKEAKTEEQPPKKEEKPEPKPLEEAEEPEPAEPTEAEVKKSKDTADKEQVVKDENIQKLIDSKKYELPIITTEKRRSRRVVALGILLSLLLAAAWANVALDANLIEVDGVKPLTDFF